MESGDGLTLSCVGDSNGDIPELSTSKEAEALREHLDEAQSEVAELRE